MEEFYDEGGRKVVLLHIVRRNGTVARHEFDTKEQARKYLEDNQTYLHEYCKKTKYRAYIKSRMMPWDTPFFHIDFDSPESAHAYVEAKGYCLKEIKELPLDIL